MPSPLNHDERVFRHLSLTDPIVSVLLADADADADADAGAGADAEAGGGAGAVAPSVCAGSASFRTMPNKEG